MKRLIRQSIHNIGNRDKALLYIDGNIIIGDNHPTMISDYLSNYNKNALNKLIEEYKQNGGDEDNEYWGALMQFSEYERNDGNIVSISDLGLAFGHIVYDEVNNNNDEEYDKVVYLETESITNATLGEVVDVIKSQLGDIPIYDDDSYEELSAFCDNYIQIAKIKS